MKKMMIIAVLIGGMLMPAQIMAKNIKGNNKPKIEYNKKFNKKKPQGKFKGEKINKKFDKKIACKKNNKYGKKYYKKYKKNKSAVIVINKPGCYLPPPPPIKVIYKYY